MTRISALARRLGARAVTVAVVTVVIALTAGVVIGAKMVMPRIAGTRAMCAEFTEAVGLYPGNKVTLLGIDVGTVTAIRNEPDHVLVDFTVPSDLSLPADVGAVTYSQSIVTDRHVELTKAYDGGAVFTGPECIPLQSTRTPIGVSETYSALGDLTNAILGPGEGKPPAEVPGVKAINEALAATNRSLDGTGPALNQTLRNLVTMIGDPHKADSDYGQLLENSEIITSGWLKHWNTFAEVITTLPETTALIEGLSDNFASALSRLVHLLPILIETLDRFAPRAYHNITDKLIPWVTDLLNAYTPHILGFINALPPAVNWLADIYEPAWGTHNITYVAPRVVISPTQVGAICAELLERNTPGSAAACAQGTASDPVTLGLTDLVLGAALG
ncbi:MlaD family protein [Mycolicibacterium houstonense]|uniref:MlaD family protein n=1 Tax=Mycolicibacterium houstonense TaxID=146021 RepID=UPI003F99B943